jgi:hypothetical protein
MSRLSKADLTLHRAWLSDWRAPAEMASYLFNVNAGMGSADFFCQRGVTFFRDAWLAAEFGRHRQSRFVRLVPEREQWPDFEAKDGDLIERVECAEADVPGRRRGDEYRKLNKRRAGEGRAIDNDPVEDWIARADQVPSALASVIASKIGKHYASSASLLIYLNIAEFGIRQAEIEAAMLPAITPALPCFQNIWILWKQRLYGPWST